MVNTISTKVQLCNRDRMSALGDVYGEYRTYHKDVHSTRSKSLRVLQVSRTIQDSIVSEFCKPETGDREELEATRGENR